MQSQIKESMPVKGADDNTHGGVDKIDGESIKLTKHDSGTHHWLPLSAVDDMDKHVHQTSAPTRLASSG